MRCWLVFMLSALLLIGSASAEFKIKSMNILFNDMQKDGSVSVTETVTFVVIGDYEQKLYKSGFDKNDLSFWASATGLSDIGLHVNPNVVDVHDLTITPQPLKCVTFLNTCDGKIITTYVAAPNYNKTDGTLIPETGIFKVEASKPRTTRYTLNPKALAFTPTEYGDMILEKYATMTIELPKNSVVYKISPAPEEYEKGMKTLSWKDTMLVHFTLVFDIEESINTEVTEFFSSMFVGVENALKGPHGIAIIIMLIILLASYIYLKSVSKKKQQ